MSAKRTTVHTVFESEILSQSQLLSERTATGREAANKAAALLDSSVTHLVIAARGSSDCVATYLQYLVGQELGVLTALATPSLYSDPRHVMLKGALVIGISQSGRSPDVVSVLTAARTQGRPTIAITNDVLSPMAEPGRRCDAPARRRGSLSRGDQDNARVAAGGLSVR